MVKQRILLNVRLKALSMQWKNSFWDRFKPAFINAAYCSVSHISELFFTRSSSNKCTITLYRPVFFVWLIANFWVTVLATSMSKTNFAAHINYLRACWNDTDDEILPVFAHFLWLLKFTFSSSYEKLFLVLFQQLFTAFAFRKCEKRLLHTWLDYSGTRFLSIKN